MYKVDILLATYNGDRYISQQLDSLLNQVTEFDFSIIISDDGSTDQTIEIVSEYASQNSKIRFLEDKILNRGAKGRFSFLLSNTSADYVLFSDQDDIWLPEKTQIMMNKIIEIESKSFIPTPILCFSDLIVVDENLEIISESLWKYQGLSPSVDSTFSRAIIQNDATGCTMVINRPLINLATPIPSNAVMHDWWLFIVAKAFGVAYPVRQATVKYRQHSSNTLGAKNTSIIDLFRKIIRFSDNSEVKKIYKEAAIQAKEFNEVFEDNLFKDLIDKFLFLEKMGFWERKNAIVTNRFFRNGLIQNISWVFRL